MFAPLKQREFMAQLPLQKRDRADEARLRCMPRDHDSVQAVFGPHAMLLTPKVLGRLDMAETYYCLVDSDYIGTTLELTKQQRMSYVSVVRFLARDVLTHTVTTVVDGTRLLELHRFLTPEEDAYYYGTGRWGDPIYVFVRLRDVCQDGDQSQEE